MAIAEILAEIDSEIGRLQEIRRLLSNTSRFPGDGSIASRKKRTLSPEARQRIAEGLYHGVESYLHSTNSLTSTATPAAAQPMAVARSDDR